MKRIFSALLVLCMLVCLIPMQAMADEFDDIFGADTNYDPIYTVYVHKDGDYVAGIQDWYGTAAPNTQIVLETPAQYAQMLSGYEISGVEVWVSDSDAPAQTGVNSFTMPDCGVAVKVFYTPASGGTNPGGTTSTLYSITRGTISNGSVLFSAETAIAKTPVTITPKPHDGYALNALTVKDGNNNAVPLTLKDGKYEFKMPASDVRVDAYFVPAITVTFEYNDGVSPARPVQVPQGGTLTELPTPTRTGYLFLGWYMADNTQVSAATKFDQSTTVRAHWVKVAHTTVPGNNKFGADIGLRDEEILNMLVTPEEMASGKDITVRLVVDPLTDANVPNADKAAIENMAGEDTVASYLDIRLLKKVGDASEFTITNTKPNTVPITMTIDAGVIPANAGQVYIVYYHDGVAKTLPATYNAASCSLTFNACEFSTYALAYKVGSPGTLDNVPKTGEASSLGSWILMALCCTVMLACISIYDKKRAR